jgi:hypothetical protein
MHKPLDINGLHQNHKLGHKEEGVTPHVQRNRRKRNYDGAAPELSSPSVESPEGKWIARVQAGVLIVNQIESTFFQETGVRFQFPKYESRDRATIFGPDLDDCPILLALFSNGCDFCWQWSHGADFTARDAPTS